MTGRIVQQLELFDDEFNKLTSYPLIDWRIYRMFVLNDLFSETNDLIDLTILSPNNLMLS